MSHHCKRVLTPKVCSESAFDIACQSAVDNFLRMYASTASVETQKDSLDTDSDQSSVTGVDFEVNNE